MPPVADDEAGETSVCAVVVTHNRAALLRDCLRRLGTQTRRPDRILVVDNASTDETADVLRREPGVDVLTLDKNVGGSGGFARGVEQAFRDHHDWIWLLDDDTLADEGCLEALLAGAGRAPGRPSVVASVVRWQDGRLHPMNRPWLRLNRRAEFAEAAAVGLAPIRTATFVSAMVHRDAVAAHGLPPAHYFLWLDDMAYTGLVLRTGRGYLVPESTVWHWTPLPYSTLSDSRERFYYKARNHLWLLRGDSFAGLERAGYALAYVRAIGTYLRQSPNRRAALATTWRGVRDGLRREPG
jgi:rhamnopyranosyl-N-acetylglucosaminyl-diphospho-decaprenol beta-1,3/1,4-galactofuranosyltransferase